MAIVVIVVGAILGLKRAAKIARRQLIDLRGQRDPLNEYKAEGFTLFVAMISRSARDD